MKIRIKINKKSLLDEDKEDVIINSNVIPRYKECIQVHTDEQTHWYNVEHVVYNVYNECGENNLEDVTIIATQIF